MRDLAERLLNFRFRLRFAFFFACTFIGGFRSGGNGLTGCWLLLLASGSLLLFAGQVAGFLGCVDLGAEHRLLFLFDLEESEGGTSRVRRLTA